MPCLFTLRACLLFPAWIAPPHTTHHPVTQQRWDDVSADETVDPFALVGEEVDSVSHRLCQSVITNVPALETAAEYFFRPGVRGKRLRPTLLLLWASALSEAQPGAEMLLPDLSPPHQRPVEQRRRQQRIAEIAELIHVASLLHDDVLDDAETRRGILSLNAQAGNKLAILAGDFLLARASVTLASLQNTGGLNFWMGWVGRVCLAGALQVPFGRQLWA